MTRDEILNLKVGDKLSMTLDIEAFTGLTKVKQGARYSLPKAVVEIAVQKVSEWTGKAYVLGYLHNGPGSQISFNIGENEVAYRKEG